MQQCQHIAMRNSEENQFAFRCIASTSLPHVSYLECFESGGFWQRNNVNTTQREIRKNIISHCDALDQRASPMFHMWKVLNQESWVDISIPDSDKVDEVCSFTFKSNGKKNPRVQVTILNTCQRLVSPNIFTLIVMDRYMGPTFFNWNFDQCEDLIGIY